MCTYIYMCNVPVSGKYFSYPLEMSNMASWHHRLLPIHRPEAGDLAAVVRGVLMRKIGDKPRSKGQWLLTFKFDGFHSHVQRHRNKRTNHGSCSEVNIRILGSIIVFICFYMGSCLLQANALQSPYWHADFALVFSPAEAHSMSQCIRHLPSYLKLGGQHWMCPDGFVWK